MRNDDKLLSLNGVQYARAITAGAKWLSDREKQLDDINLFPVPDADTGTNMKGTVVLLAENPEYYQQPTIGEASQRIAEATIVSAKGNSGSILAQFFQGMSEGLESFESVNMDQFASAVKIASVRAREAISDPKEGTILTVIQDWSNYLCTLDNQEKDFTDYFQKSLHIAQESLQRTKEQMEILRNANVVDAGAQGFVFLLEGIVDSLSHGSIQRDRWAKATTVDIKFQQDFDFEDTQFRFCTEALISGHNINKTRIKEELTNVGDSLVVIGSETKVRIHVHTNDPGKVYAILRTYGTIIQEKMDDMHQQQQDTYGNVSRDIVLITDTSCDLPEDLIKKYNIHRIPFGINVGGITHYDERTITNEEFYQYMLEHEDLPKTSQIGISDTKRMLQWTDRNFQHSILLIIPRPLSASIDNVKKAAQSFSSNIYPIDPKTLCVGSGLIAVEVGKAIQKGRSIKEVLAIIQWASENVMQAFTVENLVYLMRGGRLSKGKMFLGNLLHLKPILHVEKDGSLHQLGTALGGSKGAQKKMLKHIASATQEMEHIRFGISHALDEKKAKWYQDKIQKLFHPASIFVTDISPTLGTHSGPGTIAIAWLPDFETMEAQGKVNLRNQYPSIFESTFR
ncbi:MAG: DegV family protein [Caldisericia bacterium]|nr:DegV family protein [Caldisericia bacterium]MDD4614653.1 DegV family protein [Caldisericia bacterium]